jgi:acyl-CoA reductase-like NAD-dependent aldehyde dehydrogenase
MFQQVREYGLSSAVHTRDLERGVRFGLRLDAGMTHVNDSPVNEEDHTRAGSPQVERQSTNQSDYSSRTDGNRPTLT